MARLSELVTAVAVMIAMTAAVVVTAGHVPDSNCDSQLLCAAVKEAQLHMLSEAVPQSCGGNVRIVIKKFSDIPAEHMGAVLSHLVELFVGERGVFVHAATTFRLGVLARRVSLSANALHGAWGRARNSACSHRDEWQQLPRGAARRQIRLLKSVRRKLDARAVLCEALHEATVLQRACASLANNPAVPG